MALKSVVYLLVFLSFFCSCSTAEENKQEKPKAAVDSVVELLIPNEYKYNFDFGQKPGIAGFFDVPEMLSLCLMDSARLSMMSKKVEQAYHDLQKDLAVVQVNGPGIAGQIIYSTDTSNFKFECFQLLYRMPKVQPKKTKVVVLEAEKMLVYNYYGAYHNLPAAYFEIMDYLKKNALKQAGPFREYYVTDPTKERDSKKWLTVIMLPVRK